MSLTFRTILALCCSLASACGGASPPVPDAAEASDLTPDAGADAGCGLTFDEAVAAYPGERVCQTTVYDLRAGYCTHWVPCSSL